MYTTSPIPIQSISWFNWSNWGSTVSIVESAHVRSPRFFDPGGFISWRFRDVGGSEPKVWKEGFSLPPPLEFNGICCFPGLKKWRPKFLSSQKRSSCWVTSFELMSFSFGFYFPYSSERDTKTKTCFFSGKPRGLNEKIAFGSIFLGSCQACLAEIFCRLFDLGVQVCHLEVETSHQDLVKFIATSPQWPKGLGREILLG